MQQLTFGGLFAGIGGFDKGFESAGMRCLWQAEKDRDALRVLAHHWPGVLRHDDVCTAGKHNLPPVDVVCGGFPCQDLSVAGKRAGLGGERSGLFYEMTRIVHELRPALLVWENVPGLLSSGRGRDFLAVLTELDRIGYPGCWTTLDARWFGVAQRRRRVFGVFARADVGAERCAEILALARRGAGHPAPGGEEEPDAAAGPGEGVAFSLRGGDGRRLRGARQDGADNLIPCAAAKRSRTGGNGSPERGDETLVYQCHGNNVGPMGTVRSGNGGLTGGVPFIVNAAESCAKESHARESDTARCLDGFGAEGNQGGTVVAFDKYNQAETGDIGCTIGAGSRQHNNAHLPHLISGMMVRRLTPTECARLQGFPDDWLDLDPPLSDSAKYRMLGNAVCVPVARWLGAQIVANVR